MYQPSQEGAGTICDSETAMTISATSIWKPALQCMPWQVGSTSLLPHVGVVAVYHCYEKQHIICPSQMCCDILMSSFSCKRTQARCLPVNCSRCQMAFHVAKVEG